MQSQNVTCTNTNTVVVWIKYICERDVLTGTFRRWAVICEGNFKGNTTSGFVVFLSVMYLLSVKM